jgi:cobalt/nickel transport system permease protein
MGKPHPKENATVAHIPDGFLSPAVTAGTTAVSAVALAVAARRSGTQLRDRQAPLLGALTAFVFAAQMLNFPLGAGTSAHLLGGVLVAVLAGPWAAMLALFSVVLVQALLFQDGGIVALGANTLNLSVIGAGGGYLAYRWQLALLGDRPRARLAAAGVAAFLATAAIGIAVALELALSGMVPLGPAVVAVGGAHLLVGLAEAALTVGILAAVLRARPELVRDTAPSVPVRASVVVATGAAAVALIAVVAASPFPDALEHAAERLGLAPGTGWSGAPMADYVAPVGSGWVAAAIGVVVAFGLGWVLIRMVGRASGSRRDIEAA